MKQTIFGLTVALGLAGCVTTQTTVPAAPLTGVDAQIYNLIVDVTLDQVIAEGIAEDCPRFRYDRRVEDRQIDGIIAQSEALLNGDFERASRLFSRLESLTDQQRRAVVEPRLLAYIKANDYLPGSVEGACRVGARERRDNTTIGQLLVPA